jgi:yecA family protein
MDTLIKKKEEKQLKKLLSLAPMPEIALSYNELSGYLYGIAITPDLVQPSEWIPVIFGEGMPEYESAEQAQQLIDTLLSVLNHHISGFHKGSLYMPFDMASLTDKDVDNVWEWTSGFEEALALRPQCWEEEQESLTEEEQDHLIYSLIVIEGVVHPDEAMDMFDHISKAELLELGVMPAEGEAEKALQVQVYLLQALELAVETIQNHGAKLEARRQDQIRSSDVPFPVRSSVIGRNESCPCGSTKKYKECCTRKSQEKTALYDVKSKKGKGKVVKGNFPQHHKNPQGKKPKKNNFKGTNYQLKITLAYTEPPVWRSIQIPALMTLADLHMVAQFCMGWQDRHMHQYQIGLKFYGPQMADDYDDSLMLDETRFTLLDLEKELLQGIVYTYDLGDNWEHVIMLEKVIPESEGATFPILLDGGRECPPEDIGGIPGYQYFLEALADPNHEEHEELSNLPGLQGYDPDHVAKDAVNHLLQTVYGKK